MSDETEDPEAFRRLAAAIYLSNLNEAQGQIDRGDSNGQHYWNRTVELIGKLDLGELVEELRSKR